MKSSDLTRAGMTWRLLGGLVVLSLVALGIAAALHDNGQRQDGAVAVVLRGDLEDVVLATGTLNATGMVSIGAQVNGQVRTLLVKVGDRVRRGQLLAEIDPALARSALDKARAVRDAAQAQLAMRSMTLQRLQKVLDRQLALRNRQANAEADVESAGGDVDTARSELTVAQAQWRQAQLDVDAAQAGLDFTAIRAPVAGEILHIAAQPGQTLVSTQASPTLMVMGSLDVMTLKARIGEADVIRVRAGQKALFTIAGVPGRTFSGIVRAVESLPAQSLAD